MSDPKTPIETENDAVIEKPAILFAFDGTIMNTGPAILASYRHTFAVFHRSEQFSREAQYVAVNTPVHTMFETYMPEEDVEACVKEYRYYQKNHLIDLIQPTKGAVDLLRLLKNEGYAVGIVSVRERSSLVDLLKRHNMEQYIDVMIGAARDNHTSLSAETILSACRLLNAKHCIYVSDSANNIVVGKTAGTFTIGYVDNRDKTYSMVEAGPDFLTGDFSQIDKLIHGEPLWIAYEVQYPEEETKRAKKAAKAKDTAGKKTGKKAKNAK